MFVVFPFSNQNPLVPMQDTVEESTFFSCTSTRTPHTEEVGAGIPPEDHLALKDPIL